MDTEYYIAKHPNGDMSILFSKRVFYDSGYFACFNDIVLIFSSREIKTISDSSPKGFIKNHPDYLFKKIRQKEFSVFNNFFDRTFDVIKGIIFLNADNASESSNVFYLEKENKIEFIKLLPIGKWKYLEICNGQNKYLEINSCKQNIIKLDQYKPISSELYDLVLHLTETNLLDYRAIMSTFFNRLTTEDI